MSKSKVKCTGYQCGGMQRTGVGREGRQKMLAVIYGTGMAEVYLARVWQEVDGGKINKEGIQARDDHK